MKTTSKILIALLITMLCMPAQAQTDELLTEAELSALSIKTGDKQLDKYNSQFRHILRAKKSATLEQKKENYENGARMRNFYTWRGDFSEKDAKFAELTSELTALYNELKPHFDKLEPVSDPAALVAERIASEEKDAEELWIENNQNSIVLNYNYTGSDAAKLKELAMNAFKKGLKGDYKMLYSGFKHGWVVDEERSGQRVVAHVKRLRYLFLFEQGGKYWRAEATFVQRAPILGSYSIVDWPRMGFFSNPIPKNFLDQKLAERKK